MAAWGVVLLLTGFWKGIFRPLLTFIGACFRAGFRCMGCGACCDSEALHLRASEEKNRFALKWLPHKIADRIIAGKALEAADAGTAAIASPVGTAAAPATAPAAAPPSAARAATGRAGSRRQDQATGCCDGYDDRVGDASIDGRYKLCDVPNFSKYVVT
jgi:hypothetical protein